jgi:hypothetical protein
MKNFAIIVTLLLGSISAWADRPPVNSLNDLPAKWDGVAGSLFAQEQGSLSIDRIIRVIRDEKPGSFAATYEVEASLKIGARTIGVSKIELSSSSQAKAVYWITLQLNDDLVPRVFGAITYDEATNTYALREMPRQGGERRFSFTAPASK